MNIRILVANNRPVLKRMLSGNWINFLIKVGIFILLYWAIYKQVFQYQDIDYIIERFKTSFGDNSLFLLLLVCFMVFFNWGLETLKWKDLMSKVENISFFNAYKAIICGITFAVFTPNRVGEYGGRIFYLQKANKIQAIFITLIGSFSQIVITISMGMLGLVFYLKQFDLGFYTSLAVWGVFLLLIVLIIAIYYNINLVYQLLKKFHILKKVIPLFRVYKSYSFKDLSLVLVYSLLRYSIFTAQYLFLLYVFGIEVGWLNGLMIISVIFLVQTIIPSITLLELGIRGNIALFLIGNYSTNDIAILSSSFTLWLINLIIPAALGGFLILRLNFFNNKSVN
ncbi:MAG: flippase-like domain-containing protein [Bacteroidetes bacterium]|nr:flippase-like domain-containing protein [Bacteroidota bacterium]